MTETVASAAALCPSCEEPVRGPFCSRCGQSHEDMRVPFWRWVRGYLQDTFHLESKLARSVAALVARPGALTVEYLAGKRSQSVRPLRLYLAASFLFFLSWALLPPTHWVHIRDTADAQQEAAWGLTLDAPPDSQSWESVRLRRFVAIDPSNPSERVARAVGSALPKAMFLLLPAFAALLTLTFRRSGRFYGEHFVTALHLHAFGFLVLSAGRLVPWGFGKVALVGWLLGYAVLALRRVYGTGWWRTVLALAWLTVSYVMMVSVSLAAAAIVVLATV